MIIYLKSFKQFHMLEIEVRLLIILKKYQLFFKSLKKKLFELISVE